MLGYYNDIKAADESIDIDDKGVKWIKTGDLGYVDEDGFVYITGRLKRIYTTRTDPKGAIFHIFPDYIANEISSMDSVRDCAVVCIDDPILKSIPKDLLIGPCYLSNGIVAYVPTVFVSNHWFHDDILGFLLAAQKHAYCVFGSLPVFYNTIDGIMINLYGSIVRKCINTK